MSTVPPRPGVSRPPQVPQLAGATPSALQPKIRLQAPDEAPPAQPRTLVLPAPEDLGVPAPLAAAAPGDRVDWNAVRERLARLRVLSFRVDRVGQAYRVNFLMSTSRQRTHQVESTAGTEAAAVSLALERAEQVAGTR